MDRPNTSKNLSVIPFLAHADTSDQNIYQAIGIEPIINCRGTFTILGGSVERPEVLAAMDEASGYFVQYDELADAVGQKLATLTGAEWGMIPAGCAAGLKHVTAACVTGGNPEKLIRIPNLAGLTKTQVIIPAHSRNVYDHAVRTVGVEIITVATPQELEQAINPRTAMIYLNAGANSATGQPLSLEAIATLAKPLNIPVLVDAAAEDLTIPNIHLERGATVIAYSGGKALCGPQCAGLLLGDKALLKSAWQASSPHHGPGRDNKIGKEEIMGMLAAVEAWITRDHATEWQNWLAKLNTIAQHLADLEGISTHITEPTALSNHAPVLTISWDAAARHITGAQVAEDFARNSPRIAVGSGSADGKTTINITPNQMQPGNESVVAERIFQILSVQHTPPTNILEEAAMDISGQWDLAVHFFTSTSTHQLQLQQEGNWLAGYHTSDFSTQNISGTIEGSQVKLQSQIQRPGDSVPFLFSGTLAADTISGSIFLGEYLTAQFTAQRSSQPISHTPVTIPGGPPLAT